MRTIVTLFCCSLLWLGSAYDVAQAAWRTTGQMTEPRQDHTATLLQDGRVLIVGGKSDAGYLNTAEIWDPRSERFRATRPLQYERCGHAATLLQDGRVLITGGSTSSGELFDPSTETWKLVGFMSIGRYHHSALPLPDGKVLIFGGEVAQDHKPSWSEIWDPASGLFRKYRALNRQRLDHAAVQHEDGSIFVVGSAGDAGTTQAGVYAEAWSPPDGTWDLLEPMPTLRNRLTLTALSGFRVLAFGGSDEATGDVFSYESGTWTETRPARSGRYEHTATLLHDGTLLVVGGFPKEPVTAAQAHFEQASLALVERWDPRRGLWRTVEPLQTSRHRHTATLLLDGRVLVAGGLHTVKKRDALTLASAELWGQSRASYEKATAQSEPPPGSIPSGKWKYLKPLLTPRAEHTATLLRDGRVLLVGGSYSKRECSHETDTCGSSFTAPGPAVWDPKTERTQAAGEYPNYLFGHTATLLLDGQVLITGGGRYAESKPSADVFRFQPSTGQWQKLPGLTQKRARHTATVLSDGRVLLAGGEGDSEQTASAEIWAPSNDKVQTVASMGQARKLHTATLLPDGRVLVIGGKAAKKDVTSVEVYDPRRNTWQAAPPLPEPRSEHSATLLPNGAVLVIGGDAPVRIAEASWPGSTAVLRDPVTGQWSAAGALSQVRARHSALLLSDGLVVVVGGAQSSTVEVWDPKRRAFRSVAHTLAEVNNEATVLATDGRVLIFGGEPFENRIQAGQDLGAVAPQR